MKVSSFTNYYKQMPNWLQGVLWGGLFARFLIIAPIVLGWFIQSLCTLGIDIDCNKYEEIFYLAIVGGAVIPTRLVLDATGFYVGDLHYFYYRYLNLELAIAMMMIIGGLCFYYFQPKKVLRSCLGLYIFSFLFIFLCTLLFWGYV